MTRQTFLRTRISRRHTRLCQSIQAHCCDQEGTTIFRMPRPPSVGLRTWQSWICCLAMPLASSLVANRTCTNASRSRIFRTSRGSSSLLGTSMRAVRTLRRPTCRRICTLRCCSVRCRGTRMGTQASRTRFLASLACTRKRLVWCTHPGRYSSWSMSWRRSPRRSTFGL